jgi:hypothetical protein
MRKSGCRLNSRMGCPATSPLRRPSPVPRSPALHGAEGGRGAGVRLWKPSPTLHRAPIPHAGAERGRNWVVTDRRCEEEPTGQVWTASPALVE